MNDQPKVDIPQTTPWTKHFGPEALEINDLPTAPAVDIETVLAEAVEQYADAPFVTTALPNGTSATLSFRQAEKKSKAFAAWLQAHPRLKPGDVIAIQGPNCAAYIVAMLGVLRGGFVLSNVNPLYTVDETLHQIDDCKAKAIIFADLFGDSIDAVMAKRPALSLVKFGLTDFLPPLKKGLTDFALKRIKKLVPPMTSAHSVFADALKAGADLPLKAVQGSAKANGARADFYQYSGGTTGKSKGVALSFAALVHNVAQAGALVPSLLEREGRRTMLVLPLYHMFGFYVAMVSLRLGGELVLIPSPRPLSNLKKPLEKFPPDVFPGVSTLFAYLMNEEWFRAAPPKLELTFTGAMPMDPTVAKEWREMTGADIFESYGMTEATTVLTSNPPGELFRQGSVGMPIPGTTLRILDDDGNWAPNGTPGEIVAKGPQIMSGYLGDAALNENAFHDGWLRTGDIGYIDDDGYLFLVDRKKDMLIVGGFNVFPTEIEQVLAAHPTVLEAGVVGAADGAGGERPVAFVVRSDESVTAEELMAHCAEHLTNYKRPKEIRFIDALPKSPVGKILRRELRDTL